MSWISGGGEGIPWPKRGPCSNLLPCTAQLELPYKGRAFKGLVICNIRDVRALGPTLKVLTYVIINCSKKYQSDLGMSKDCFLTQN